MGKIASVGSACLLHLMSQGKELKQYLYAIFVVILIMFAGEDKKRIYMGDFFVWSRRADKSGVSYIQIAIGIKL